MKWVILIAGVFLFFNGMFTRTYSFENENPARHCYQMDYIGLYGCFGLVGHEMEIVGIHHRTRHQIVDLKEGRQIVEPKEIFDRRDRWEADGVLIRELL